jgi:hypothetical protein
MVVPYQTLSEEAKYFHIYNMTDTFVGENGDDVPYSVMGIYASGEANYYDEAQNPITITFFGHNFATGVFQGTNPLYSLPITNIATSPIEPYGLYFNASLSNARDSINYSINDFSIFEPYIHNDPNPGGGMGMLDKTSFAFIVDTSKFITLY